MRCKQCEFSSCSEPLSHPQVLAAACFGEDSTCPMAVVLHCINVMLMQSRSLNCTFTKQEPWYRSQLLLLSRSVVKKRLEVRNFFLRKTVEVLWMLKWFLQKGFSFSFLLSKNADNVKWSVFPRICRWSLNTWRRPFTHESQNVWTSPTSGGKRYLYFFSTIHMVKLEKSCRIGESQSLQLWPEDPLHIHK